VWFDRMGMGLVSAGRGFSYSCAALARGYWDVIGRPSLLFIHGVDRVSYERNRRF